MRRLIGATWVLGLVGCGDPLVDPQTVVGLRVLGARVSATEEPSRAHLTPGEDATIEWLVLAEKTRDFKGLALWCEAQPSSFGTPPCVDPFKTVEFEGTSDAPVTLTFNLPEEHKTGRQWVHWIGLCETGNPNWDEDTQRFECSRGEVVSAVYRGNMSASNTNPNIGDDELSLDGEEWVGAGSSETPSACGDAHVPDVDVKQSATIHLQANGSDREELQVDEYAAATHESLTYTHVTTWPGLERPYSLIDESTYDAAFELEFLSEGGTPQASGDLVRFALIVRDGRGGTDWIERWFCLKP